MSEYFLPTLRNDPSEAEIVSHRLMLRAGMIRQESAGIYSWLPLGFRVLKKIEQIVREEQDRIGAHEILMPTIQSADLWRKSGRYDDYGKEMLRITDRHEREMLFGPTNEEMITDIYAEHAKSYKDAPLMMYHIQWKFRDEVRPRYGVMRGREFLMKDAYSFDVDAEAGRHSYNKQFIAYLRTYARLGLKAVPMAADTGPIGGDLSHEFIILASTGESEVWCDEALLEFDLNKADVDLKDPKAVQAVVDEVTAPYAATDELHDQSAFEASVPEARRVAAKGIEVGHIFFFGDKYARPMGAAVDMKAGERAFMQMGSYGVGVSRLAGAVIEASHDEAGIVWPSSIAPFGVALINLRVGDEGCDTACENFFAQCVEAGVEILYDDRDERAGVKFSDMELIGVPWQVIIGPKGVKAGVVEVKNRATGEKQELSAEAALSMITG